MHSFRYPANYTGTQGIPQGKAELSEDVGTRAGGRLLPSGVLVQAVYPFGNSIALIAINK
jgi:hypothetical protein